MAKFNHFVLRINELIQSAAMPCTKSHERENSPKSRTSGTLPKHDPSPERICKPNPAPQTTRHHVGVSGDNAPSGTEFLPKATILAIGIREVGVVSALQEVKGKGAMIGSKISFATRFRLDFIPACWSLYVSRGCEPLAARSTKASFSEPMY